MESNPTRVNISLTDKEKVDLRITCILAKCSMSHFIRLAIKEKIRQIKTNKNDGRA